MKIPKITENSARPTTKPHVDKIISKIEDDGKTIRLNVDIPKSLHKKLKNRATDEDRSIKELVIELLMK